MDGFFFFIQMMMGKRKLCTIVSELSSIQKIQNRIKQQTALKLLLLLLLLLDNIGMWWKWQTEQFQSNRKSVLWSIHLKCIWKTGSHFIGDDDKNWIFNWNPSDPFNTKNENKYEKKMMKMRRILFLFYVDIYFSISFSFQRPLR